MIGTPVPGLPAPGQTLTQEIVRRIFDYDPDTGALVRRVSYERHVGKRVDAQYRGRRRVLIARKLYEVSRVIWLYVYGHFPDCDVDHIDRDPLNDRLDNLRLASRAQNASNRGLSKNNRSGIKGVRQRGPSRWVAGIGFENRWIHLGSFRTAEAARDAYNAAALKLHGQFACLN
ncbi:HNH endonuclease [Bosea sp. RCC_152_1]|uniref:HNH endonuclease n=1 Tax=Bosea sp. RCC_152_1 TaxID=3239228 RepID=UPI0035261CD5